MAARTSIVPEVCTPFAASDRVMHAFAEERWRAIPSLDRIVEIPPSTRRSRTSSDRLHPRSSFGGPSGFGGGGGGGGATTFGFGGSIGGGGGGGGVTGSGGFTVLGASLRAFCFGLLFSISIGAG